MSRTAIVPKSMSILVGCPIAIQVGIQLVKLQDFVAVKFSSVVP